ncbi:hypothetical protein IV203_003746 [Nitzschia inconspicua]|uniref:Matrin-type domain-containing protein n=1 Tax=Nitzschia inconspicua TaxID=303405 RepID=A0A9K3L408_9STRA|nr:hypothetical protein IV203_003746 [Nitzschia inconspicua]
MSTNLNYKQVTNVARRTWDVEAYEKRAQERLKNETAGGGSKNKSKQRGSTAVATNGEAPPLHGGVYDDDNDAHREEFVPAAAGAAKAHQSQRAYLKARSSKVDSLDSKIGSVEIINPEATATVRSKVTDSAVGKDTAVTKSGVGWHCRVCDCFLRDSHAYLDHINGRKHQRNLGYSMRVERSTKDQVADRLAALIKQKEKSKKKESEFDEPQEEEMYHDMVKAKDEELRKKQEERKRERKERRKKKKAEQKDETISASTQDTKEEDGAPEANEDDDDEEEEEAIDPNLAAMMGFSGFGGAAKGR